MRSHPPCEIRRIGPILYLNDGDWVESCTSPCRRLPTDIWRFCTGILYPASAPTRFSAGAEGEAALIPRVDAEFGVPCRRHRPGRVEFCCRRAPQPEGSIVNRRLDAELCVYAGISAASPSAPAEKAVGALAGIEDAHVQNLHMSVGIFDKGCTAFNPVYRR